MFPPPPAGGPLIPPTLPNSEPFGRQDECLALGEGQPGEGWRELRSESDSPSTFVLRQPTFALRRQKYLQAQRINSRLKALLSELTPSVSQIASSLGRCKICLLDCADRLALSSHNLEYLTVVVG